MSQCTKTWGIALGKLAENGDIAAAVNLIVDRTTDARLALPDFIKPSAWEDAEFPTGGHGDDITYSSGRVPSEYEFENSAWEALWGYLPDEVQEWLCTYWEEQGP